MKTEQEKIPTGDFSFWLKTTRQAQITNEAVDVPCDDCTACCTSSYFIHIKPDETRTLARIPKELLFPAPGLPKGNVLMGYDENGICPMFSKDKCSIYEDRPQTCRSYDCRIFPATGLKPDDENKTLIAQQAQRWRFNLTTEYDRQQISAVQAAAKFLNKHAERFPDGFVPSNTTQQAILAIKVYEIFLNHTHESLNNEPDQIDRIVHAVLDAYKKFEMAGNT